MHAGFGLDVELAGGLVENENPRIAQNCAGQGHALALPARDILPPRSPTWRLKALGKFGQEIGHAGQLGRLLDPFRRRHYALAYWMLFHTVPRNRIGSCVTMPTCLRNCLGRMSRRFTSSKYTLPMSGS